MNERTDQPALEALMSRLATLEEQHTQKVAHLEKELANVRARHIRPRIRHSQIIAIAILALLLPVVLTAGAAANSPQTTVTYYGCVNNISGAIKIVSLKTPCPTGTYKISWDQVGPAGPTGPQGTQGPTGPAGPQGPQGPSGLSQGYYGQNNQAVTMTSRYPKVDRRERREVN